MAKVVVCQQSIPILTAGKCTEQHEYKNWLGRVLEKGMAGPIGSYPTVMNADRMKTAYDGDSIFTDIGLNAKVIALPGHTSDSIGLYFPGEKILFCGDAAMNRSPLNANRHTVLIENINDFGASWDKMISLSPKLIYPGHGKPFSVWDLQKYRNYLTK